MDPSQVIIRPVVSEKSYVLAAADKYTFRVHADAHKTQIRQAVEALFDVKVVERPHRRRSSPSPSAAATPPGARARGRRRSSRCAPGDSIPIFQGLQGLEELAACRFASPSPPAPVGASSTYPDFAEITKTEPEKSLVEGLKKSGGRNANGRKTVPPPRRRRQAPVPQDRLQAPQGRRAGEGRRDRVRPQPLGLHRAAALRRRREALHPGAAAPARSA